MSEDKVPSADFEGRFGRLEEAAPMVVPSEEKLARTAEARMERDRAVAFEAWRRWP